MSVASATGGTPDPAGWLVRQVLRRRPPFIPVAVLGAGLLTLAVAGMRAPMPHSDELRAATQLLGDLARDHGWLALPMPEPAAGPAAVAEPASEEPGPSLDDVAADLRSRRERLDAREQELEQRAAVVAAAERKLGGQLATLTALRDEVKKLLGEVDADRQARLAQLIKTYEAMPPKRAAAIFNGLDLEALERLLRGMREARIAPILAAMDPDRARALTVALAARRDPPAIAPGTPAIVRTVPPPQTAPDAGAPKIR